MTCPLCQHADSSVIETRQTEQGIRRRRECCRCRHRWTTFEISAEQFHENERIKSAADELMRAVGG